MSSEGTWETVKIDSDYEICTTYPYQIRRKSDHYKISETLDTHSNYIFVTLNGIKQSKHRLIALQWIENDDPEHKKHVDHRNKIRTDNHISNLHWATPRFNCFNKLSNAGIEYEYFDEIPDESVPINFYETRNGIRYFDDDRYYYYYDEELEEDIFYIKIDDCIYRQLYVNQTLKGCLFVNFKDINNKKTAIYIEKFKRQHDLM